MKCIIAGSRNITKYKFIEDAIKESGFNITEIISGKAKGVDLLGEEYAINNNISIKKFPAKWDELKLLPCKIKYNKYGKPYNVLAGRNRNEEMLNYILPDGGLIAIWDGKSTGTSHMISISRNKNIKVYIKYI